ncbi:MAG: hypothetical protein GWN00_31290, partial [Aliifodinibius sp.]|nr:Ig-like domain-containing protein [Fodinibius sp.]NIV15238.1 hypothetical protein [Fodinibius sp.]NIY29109.1 hypothetical protein [Fodinibius sp.]
MFNKFIVLILSIALLLVLWGCQGDEGEQGVAGANAMYIVLSPTTAVVIVDSTIAITAATNGLDGTETYTWSSSNTDVATVSAAGVVTGVATGLAFIGATGNSSGAASFASITVSEQAATEVSFSQHILPLFTTDEIWFPGTEKCTACHSGEGPYSHELDMGSWQGVITGADGGDEPILGNDPGQTNYDWGSSGLRRRLRNNRMPPHFPFVMDMSNR